MVRLRGAFGRIWIGGMEGNKSGGESERKARGLRSVRGQGELPPVFRGMDGPIETAKKAKVIGSPESAPFGSDSLLGAPLTFP